MKQLYDTTRKLAVKYGKPERPVKDKQGKTIQRNRWVEYFGELLNKTAPVNPPDIEEAHTGFPIDVTPQTIEKIRMAIRQIKSGEAAGPDNIPVEALMSDKKATANIIYVLFRKVWKEGHLIKMPKEGCLSKCENYRGVILLSVPGKFSKSVAQSDEVFTRRLASRPTCRIP
ncbi:unnamed protein product [Schistosoma mattheei]|uniref:Uncharacterized protein n=1 Tax=Schistosoma mattheei TaxID=31246 RepID=A0A183NDN0_9TREM|nr:unnamed protein product [Schistosoma mattheei]